LDRTQWGKERRGKRLIVARGILKNKSLLGPHRQGGERKGISNSIRKGKKKNRGIGRVSLVVSAGREEKGTEFFYSQGKKEKKRETYSLH